MLATHLMRLFLARTPVKLRQELEFHFSSAGEAQLKKKHKSFHEGYSPRCNNKTVAQSTLEKYRASNLSINWHSGSPGSTLALNSIVHIFRTLFLCAYSERCPWVRSLDTRTKEEEQQRDQVLMGYWMVPTYIVQLILSPFLTLEIDFLCLLKHSFHSKRDMSVRENIFELLCICSLWLCNSSTWQTLKRGRWLWWVVDNFKCWDFVKLWHRLLLM